MAIQFYNQLTKQIDTFIPLEPGKVSLYTCGPTVYSYLHIGNWAAYIYWDILVRLLLVHDYQVDRVMNITDVGHLVSDADEGEDKLEKGARREGKTAWEVAAFYGADFLANMDRLGLITPTHITKATDFIPQQLELVRILKEKGFTYQIDDGIYFDTAQFPSYAAFAGLDLKALQAGARVEFNEEKRNPSDFALWKFTPAGEKRDMEWATPGNLLETTPTSNTPVMGFPGWHLECSAMSMSLLGNTLDIHTGGIDHIPVHHTNEIAQSEAATGELFSRYWLHNNHLKVNGTKISKSLDNGYTLNDLEARGYTLDDYRLFILQSHYQSEGNFTFENLDAAKNRLLRWRNVAALRHQIHDTLKSDHDIRTNSDTIPSYAASTAIIETLDNNLDTPGALKVIDTAFGEITTADHHTINQDALIQVLETIEATLGLHLLSTTPDIADEDKQRILERERARDEKDWQRADEVRDALLAHGITVRDTSHGPIWEYDSH